MVMELLLLDQVEHISESASAERISCAGISVDLTLYRAIQNCLSSLGAIFLSVCPASKLADRIMYGCRSRFSNAIPHARLLFVSSGAYM